MRCTGNSPPPLTGTTVTGAAGMTSAMVDLLPGSRECSGRSCHAGPALNCPQPVQTMLPPRRIKHCRACGTPVQYRIPSDDNRERAVCAECGTVHYENPLNVVGTLPVWQDRVLLCKRNIEPRYGMWTL